MKAVFMIMAAGLVAAGSASTVDSRAPIVSRDDSTVSVERVHESRANLRNLAKEETNNFYIQGAQITSCTELSHSITSGQPYGGLSCSGNTITIKAGRKNSAGVANSFKNGLTGSNMFCSDGSCGSTPDDLNFYVTMNLTMIVGGQKLTLESLRVGQGHYFTTNNWWIAGSKCSDNGKTLDCGSTTADTSVLFTQGGSDKVSASAVSSFIQPGR